MEPNWNTIFTTPQTVTRYHERVRERDRDLSAFLELDPARGLEITRGLTANSAATTQRENGSSDSPSAPSPSALSGSALSGLPFAVKDNIAVAGFRLTCGSRMLEAFSSPYTATAVERLCALGAVPVGKTNLDEFGMGSSTDTSALAVTNNPWDRSRVAGGSSGGSAVAVAAGMVPFALGSDTGGSIRQPAAFCGVYGLKPTYGAISRYGLVAYASSLESIAVAAADVDTTEVVFRAMRGVDELDQSTIAAPSDLIDASSAPDPALRIGVLGGELGLDPAAAAGYRRAIDALKALGFTVSEVELATMEYSVPAYYTIAAAEASANLARYTGIRYGLRPDYAENPEELVRSARDQGFGPEVKLRILLGTYVLRSGFQDQYYLRAQKVRTAIRNDLDRLFAEVDVLLMPVFPSAAFPHGEAGLTPFQQKLADRFTTTANLAGVPALAVPAGVQDGLPVGVQVLAPAFHEHRLFSAARALTSELPPAAPPDYPPLSLRDPE